MLNGGKRKLLFLSTSSKSIIGIRFKSWDKPRGSHNLGRGTLGSRASRSGRRGKRAL